MKKASVLSYPLSTSEDSDETGRIPRLIRVLAGRKDNFVGFAMRRLKSTLCHSVGVEFAVNTTEAW